MKVKRNYPLVTPADTKTHDMIKSICIIGIDHACNLHHSPAYVHSISLDFLLFPILCKWYVNNYMLLFEKKYVYIQCRAILHFKDFFFMSAVSSIYKQQKGMVCFRKVDSKQWIACLSAKGSCQCIAVEFQGRDNVSSICTVRPLTPNKVNFVISLSDFWNKVHQSFKTVKI